MPLWRDHEQNSCHYAQFNYTVYNWTTVECPAANVLILLEKSNIHTAKWKFTALLWEKGRFFSSPKDTLGFIVAACLPALWFAPTSLLPEAEGGPSLSWAHPVRLLIHLEPELSQCHQPPIRSIGPRAGDMAQPQVRAHFLVSPPLSAAVYYTLYLH